MTFTLTINRERFESHLTSVLAKHESAGAQVVPVIKGNGYGFGRTLLAEAVSNLGLARTCVGTIWEAAEVLENFTGEVIVLEPISSSDELAFSQWQNLLSDYSARLIPMVANAEAENLSGIGVTRAWLEIKTSMHRFGLSISEAAKVVATNNFAIAGFSLHLPISQSTLSNSMKFETSDQSTQSNKVREVLGLLSWLKEISNSSSANFELLLSHMTPAEISTIHRLNPDIKIGIRLGTSLWLGDLGALKATGTVLAINDISSDDRVGYTQTSGSTRLAIISGGTAHGVALAAPVNPTNLRKRGIAIAEGFAMAAGKVRSPFSISGKNLMFAEPPHMQVSMLWLDGFELAVGDQVECNVRNTTTNFDAVIWQ